MVIDDVRQNFRVGCLRNATARLNDPRSCLEITKSVEDRGCGGPAEGDESPRRGLFQPVVAPTGKHLDQSLGNHRHRYRGKYSGGIVTGGARTRYAQAQQILDHARCSFNQFGTYVAEKWPSQIGNWQAEQHKQDVTVGHIAKVVEKPVDLIGGVRFVVSCGRLLVGVDELFGRTQDAFGFSIRIADQHVTAKLDASPNKYGTRTEPIGPS